jgi:hypothetical protein
MLESVVGSQFAASLVCDAFRTAHGLTGFPLTPVKLDHGVFAGDDA